MIHGYVVLQAMAAEFVACLLRTELMKVERVQVTEWLNGTQEIVRQ